MLLNQNNSIASIKIQKSTPYNAIRFALQCNRARVSPLSQCDCITLQRVLHCFYACTPGLHLLEHVIFNKGKKEQNSGLKMFI